MAIYALCQQCQSRREKCANVSGHKQSVRWRADVMLPGTTKRLRKTFHTQELALTQERQWRTDFERGILLPSAKPASISFTEVAKEWWTMVVGQNRIKDANRSERYRVDMFISCFGSRPIASLKFSDAETWLNGRLEQRKAVNTINRDMRPLRWIMNYAVKKGYIPKNPFLEMKDLKGGNIRIRWMTQAEIERLVETVYKIGDNSLIDVIEIGLNTGFRKGNLERLTARDISSNKITANKTKSGKPYDVPIAPSIVNTLERLLRQNETGPLLNTKMLDWRFRRAAGAAGLYFQRGNPENVTIHTLRHTFAALYLKRGGDIYKLSKLLGHSSVGITERVYGHVCPKDLEAQAPLISTNIRPHGLSVKTGDCQSPKSSSILDGAGTPG